MKKANKRTIRKNNMLPMVILVLGIVLGGALIGFGVYKNVNTDFSSLDTRSEDIVKEDINNKVKEAESLRKERNDEYDTSALSDKYVELTTKIATAEGELSDLEAELFNIQNKTFANIKNEQLAGILPFYVIGAVVIVVSIAAFIKMNKKGGSKILSMNEA